MLDARERGDLDAVYAAFHPDVDWDVSRMPLVELLAQSVYHRPDGIRDFFREYQAAWESIDFTYERFVEAEEQVVVQVSQRVRGKTSGVEMEMRGYAQLWTVRDGLITRMDMYPVADDAFSAAGVAP
jgi:ketosteroid isomerase-like protein